jgi:hypothetical protein
MGALSQVCAELDLRATSGKLRARRGTGGAANLKANFIDLFLDTGIGPDGDYERIFAQAIDGDRASLEAAVRQVSQSLTTEH